VPSELRGENGIFENIPSHNGSMTGKTGSAAQVAKKKLIDKSE